MDQNPNPEPIPQGNPPSAMPQAYPSEPIPVSPQKKTKLLTLLVIIIIAIVVGGAGVWAYKSFLAPRPDPRQVIQKMLLGLEDSNKSLSFDASINVAGSGETKVGQATSSQSGSFTASLAGSLDIHDLK